MYQHQEAIFRNGELRLPFANLLNRVQGGAMSDADDVCDEAEDDWGDGGFALGVADDEDLYVDYWKSLNDARKCFALWNAIVLCRQSVLYNMSLSYTDSPEAQAEYLVGSSARAILVLKAIQRLIARFEQDRKIKQ
jgi:hypothetical protein